VTAGLSSDGDQSVGQIRPVTPEVAGSSPVGPANRKHSCAATWGRFCFAERRNAKTTP